MAYNHGREDRKWRIWKEAEEKLLRECGVDEATIEQIRMADRADFNSNRRFYRWTNDVAEYLEDMAGRERQAEVGTVAELLEEIESENLYQVLVTVDGRTLKIVLLKMQGYSMSITLKFCTFFTLKKCTDITVFSLRVIHLFPLVDNFHQQSLLLWNDEGFYQVLPLIWYYLGICPAILRSFCLL